MSPKGAKLPLVDILSFRPSQAEVREAKHILAGADKRKAKSLKKAMMQFVRARATDENKTVIV